MTGFRILDPFPAYLNLLGVPASGGSLKFFDSETDDPKDVFGDADLTVNNGPSVLIGTDGRTVVDVWGSGSYTVRLYAPDDTLIAEAEDVTLPGGGGTAIPTLVAGSFLTNDGAVLQWEDILQVPDPTGQSGKILGNDGSNLIWQALTQFVPEIDGTSLKLGTILIQWGTDTIPASGTTSSAKAITFGKPFLSTLYVNASLNQVAGITASGGYPTISTFGWSTTGATANINFSIADGSTDITSPCAIAWLAIGTVAA